MAAGGADALHHAFKRRHVHGHLRRKSGLDVVDVAFADHVRIGREHRVRLKPHNLFGNFAPGVLHAIQPAVGKRQKRYVRYAEQRGRGERFRLTDLDEFVAVERRIQRAHASVGQNHERNVFARAGQGFDGRRAGDLNVVRVRADEEIPLKRAELRQRRDAPENGEEHIRIVNLRYRMAGNAVNSISRARRCRKGAGGV